VSLFTPKTITKDHYNSQLKSLIGYAFDNRYNDLRFGLEVEVENAVDVRYPERFAEMWTTHTDGSLRNNGIEYVTRRPNTPEDTFQALDLLETFLKQNKHLDFSERTSFHVHVNFQPRTVKDFHNFLTMYYMLENVITLRAGFENRVANHFCLRLCDSNSVKAGLLRSFQGHPHDMFGYEKYLALNLNAFGRFGTLEFRCHRGTNDVNEYRSFVQMLQEMYNTALTMDHPEVIFQGMSGLGFAEYFEQHLPITMKYLYSDPQKLINRKLVAQELSKAMIFCQGLAHAAQVVDKPTKVVDKPKAEPAYSFAETAAALDRASYTTLLSSVRRSQAIRRTELNEVN